MLFTSVHIRSHPNPVLSSLLVLLHHARDLLPGINGAGDDSRKRPYLESVSV